MMVSNSTGGGRPPVTSYFETPHIPDDILMSKYIVRVIKGCIAADGLVLLEPILTTLRRVFNVKVYLG